MLLCCRFANTLLSVYGRSTWHMKHHRVFPEFPEVHLSQLRKIHEVLSHVSSKYQLGLRRDVSPEKSLRRIKNRQIRNRRHSKRIIYSLAFIITFGYSRFWDFLEIVETFNKQSSRLMSWFYVEVWLNISTGWLKKWAWLNKLTVCQKRPRMPLCVLVQVVGGLTVSAVCKLEWNSN